MERRGVSAGELGPGEQIGIAGSSAVRGFREREVTGDSGISTTLEALDRRYREAFALIDEVRPELVADHALERAGVRAGERDLLDRVCVNGRLATDRVECVQEGWHRVAVPGRPPDQQLAVRPRAGPAVLTAPTTPKPPNDSADGACLALARKLLKRSFHILRELGDEALAPA